jgi:hypothetical protein
VYADRTPVYDSPPGIELRLKWRRTWPDKEHDFVAFADDGQQIGRFYWRDSNSPGSYAWVWFSRGSSGKAGSPREAAKAIEDVWFT